MKKTVYGLLAVIFILYLFIFVQFAFADSLEKPLPSKIGRYQIHSIQSGNLSLLLLLDTTTGKVWKYNNEQQFTGGPKFEGMTVEGLAYGASDLSSFSDSKRIENMDMEALGIPEKKKKQFKNDLVSSFSYDFDKGKIDEIVEKIKQ